MPYHYTAIDITGNQVQDTIRTGGSVADATEELRRRGLFVVTIKDVEQSVAKPARFLDNLTGGRRLGQVAALLRQLSVLMSSGTPMVQAIGALERQTPDLRFRDIVREVRERVEQGDPLHVAMKSHPGYFDPVCIGLIAAGEGGGNFNQILDRLAVMLRQQCQVRSALASAMIYPSMLLAVSVGVVVLMIGFVLPRFEGMFDTIGADMPLPTAVLMGVSRWLSAYWWVAALLMTGIAVGVWQWSQTRAGRSAIHRAAVRLPVISKVVRAFCVARIARVLGMLLTSRVPLNEALRLAHDVAGNEQFGLALAAAEETVTRGGSLSTALADSKLFAPTVCEAVRSGEQAGRLGDLLMLVADYLDEENATTLKAATAMVEPAILIVVGVIVGGIVLSIFLPLFDVAASAGGGS